MKEDKTIFTVIGIFLAFAVICSCLSFGCLGVVLFATRKPDTSDWVRQKGTITDVSVIDFSTRYDDRFGISVDYKYSYNGIDYERKSITIEADIDSEEDAERLIRLEYQIGSQLNILVDPDMPSDSALPFEFRHFGDVEYREYRERKRENRVNEY